MVGQLVFDSGALTLKFTKGQILKSLFSPMVFFVVKSHAKWAPFKPYLNHLLEIFFSAPACFKTHLMMTVTFVRHSCNDSRLLYVETALIKVHCTVGKIHSVKIMKYNFFIDRIKIEYHFGYKTRAGIIIGKEIRCLRFLSYFSPLCTVKSQAFGS